MKKKSQTKKSENLSKAEADKLRSLIAALRSEYTDKQIMFEYLDAMRHGGKWELSRIIMEDMDLKDYMKDRLKDELVYNDKLIILKVDIMQQREKLETFVFSEIYPHYNDQHNLFTSN